MRPCRLHPDIFRSLELSHPRVRGGGVLRRTPAYAFIDLRARPAGQALAAMLDTELRALEPERRAAEREELEDARSPLPP